MIGWGSIVKWVAIAGIVASIGYGLNRVYEYHLDQIDSAVNTALLESAAATQLAVTAREEQLREESQRERALIEQELVAERARVTDLQRMLLIDHDLDRLLQRKPGLILPRVNRGTEEVLQELEELTQ